MDGVIAAFETFDLIDGTDIDFIYAEQFKYANPVWPVIEQIERLPAENVYIYSVAPNSICVDQKKEWLAKHLPHVPQENFFFAGNNQYKPTTLKYFLKMKKIHPREVVFVDDNHKVITDCRALGINAIHVSKFLSTPFAS